MLPIIRNNKSGCQYPCNYQNYKRSLKVILGSGLRFRDLLNPFGSLPHYSSSFSGHISELFRCDNTCLFKVVKFLE